MKPNKLLLCLATVILLSSCKKDYTCSCFAPGEDDPTFFKMENVNKSKAKKLCKAYETYPNRVCTLQ